MSDTRTPAEIAAEEWTRKQCAEMGTRNEDHIKITTALNTPIFIAGYQAAQPANVDTDTVMHILVSPISGYMFQSISATKEDVMSWQMLRTGFTQRKIEELGYTCIKVRVQITPIDNDKTEMNG